MSEPPAAGCRSQWEVYARHAGAKGPLTDAANVQLCVLLLIASCLVLWLWLCSMRNHACHVIVFYGSVSSAVSHYVYESCTPVMYVCLSSETLFCTCGVCTRSGL